MSPFRKRIKPIIIRFARYFSFQMDSFMLKGKFNPTFYQCTCTTKIRICVRSGKTILSFEKFKE